MLTILIPLFGLLAAAIVWLFFRTFTRKALIAFAFVPPFLLTAYAVVTAWGATDFGIIIPGLVFYWLAWPLLVWIGFRLAPRIWPH